jgi:sphingolipid delta-4 desaturase
MVNISGNHKDFAVFSGSQVPETVVTEHDFIWSLKDEPHCSRRKEILAKYPQIQSLFGVEPLTKYFILLIVSIQLTMAYVFRDSLSYKTWEFWVVAYVIGGTCNQALFLAIHELSHNLGFKSIFLNKIFSIMVANVPIGLPYAASFKPYHMEHHKYQGLEGVDTDLPTETEAIIFSSTLGKFFFATFHVFFYAVRPLMVRFQPLTAYHYFNLFWIFFIDYLLYNYVGHGCVIYFLVSTLWAGSGLHPCASHFISEHYVFSGDFETYSYYGILNYLCFNVGYHNEHHDFPNIPGSRLPKLRKIASEYYDNLPYHESWPLVTWKFITDSRVSVYSRVKRRLKKGAVCSGKLD